MAGASLCLLSLSTALVAWYLHNKSTNKAKMDHQFPTLKNDLLLRAARGELKTFEEKFTCNLTNTHFLTGETVERPPIWVMRQGEKSLYYTSFTSLHSLLTSSNSTSNNLLTQPAATSPSTMKPKAGVTSLKSAATPRSRRP